MAIHRARTVQLRDRLTGKLYWVEHRIGFRGHEYNFGGGWRPALAQARATAEETGTLHEVTRN